MAEEQAPKHGRGSLSREKVLREAVAMADAARGEVPSTRKLAERLGVRAMALYHHFKNKDELLDGMVDLVFAEIELPEDGVAWDEAMRRRASSMRDALNRHPWAIALMDSRADPGPATLRHHNAVIGRLLEGGFTIAGAAHAFSLLDSYVYGFAIQEQALPFENGADMEEIAADLVTEQAAAAFPHLAAMAIELTLKPGYRYGDEFAIGLGLIVDGLAARRESW